jgi:hypothetical protein
VAFGAKLPDRCEETAEQGCLGDDMDRHAEGAAPPGAGCRVRLAAKPGSSAIHCVTHRGGCMRGRIRPQRRVVLDRPHRGKDVDRGIRAKVVRGLRRVVRIAAPGCERWNDRALPVQSCGCSTGDGKVHQEQAGVLVSPLCGGGELDCHTKVMSGDLNFSRVSERLKQTVNVTRQANFVIRGDRPSGIA